MGFLFIMIWIRNIAAFVIDRFKKRNDVWKMEIKKVDQIHARNGRLCTNVIAFSKLSYGSFFRKTGQRCEAILSMAKDSITVTVDQKKISPPFLQRQ